MLLDHVENSDEARMNLKDDTKSEIRLITEKKNKISEANLNMPKLSTPFSHIRSPVKQKEEITNPLITHLSHQDNNQALMKEEPQLKEWPTFTREGEYYRQVGTSDTSLTNIQDVKLFRTKPEKGMVYEAGKSSISIVMVENQEAKVNLDTGAYCTCVGKSYLKSVVPNWEEKFIPIQQVKFSSASESMKPLGIIDSTLIFPHPSQCIRLRVDCSNGKLH
ncbi:hypothetical protein O181_089438 [Austropuccinia psidii MF-1]|uniref:Uncharacterized protein n=1 Tax=Austropuccinia psidii MF-1 TaxID=1389203 RepID=A0A9Q3P4Q8_9BASI|nr:hypothetical protein [Austropuccinia psidii MF-1]